MLENNRFMPVYSEQKTNLNTYTQSIYGKYLEWIRLERKITITLIYVLWILPKI